MRRAFTLVEMMIAVTVGVAIFAAAMMLYAFANRSRGVTATARALQTALLIQERFCEDVARLVPAAASPVGFDKDDRSRISFWSHDTTAPAGRELAVRAVKYSLPTAPGMLVREWDRKDEPLGNAPLDSIAFVPFRSPTGTLLRVSMLVGREPGEPPGPPTSHTFLVRIPAPAFHQSLKFNVLSRFRDEKDEPDKDPIPGP